MIRVKEGSKVQYTGIGLAISWKRDRAQQERHERHSAAYGDAGEGMEVPSLGWSQVQQGQGSAQVSCPERASEQIGRTGGEARRKVWQL